MPGAVVFPVFQLFCCSLDQAGSFRLRRQPHPDGPQVLKGYWVGEEEMKKEHFSSLASSLAPE